ncbi:MAG TPA: glycosyltransferase [Steroidobacteraceae bacterium]|nr:glycosyltransferase [Steroidobacteraceae bacterium]
MQICTLARGLARRGHDVGVVTFYGGGVLEQGLRADGVAVHSLDKRSRGDIVGPVRRLCQLIRQHRWEVLDSFLPLENLLGLCAARRTGVPIVWGLRGAAVKRDQFGWASSLLYGLQFRLLSRPEAVISNSLSALRDLGIAPDERVHSVPNGIDTARFDFRPEVRAAFRAEHGCDAATPLVGIVARLDPMKDHMTFLRAARQIAAHVGAARFVVAGDGPAGYRQQLHEQARQLGIDARMLWLGEVGDSSRVYSALDVLVSSSAFGEGFSNVVAEAMSSGPAVVATDVGDSARIVGELGKVVRPQDPQALAAAVIEVLAASDTTLRAQRRARIVTEFGVEAMVVRTESILSKVIADWQVR